MMPRNSSRTAIGSSTRAIRLAVPLRGYVMVTSAKIVDDPSDSGCKRAATVVCSGSALDEA